MKAMILRRVAPMADNPRPLDLVELDKPAPGAGEVLIEVAACGVCHTELDEIEGRTAPPELPVVLGHEVVGRVAAVGEGVERRRVGERVGVGWIHSSNGEAEENLAPEFRATGRDVDGGYAEYMTVGEGYCYPIPETFSDAEAAPLLCAGAVGYRALRLAELENGQPLGLTGFGGSAHIVLQLSRHLYPDSDVYVFSRGERGREFSRELGAVWAGGTADRAPVALQAIIDTTPAWKPIVEALANLRPGGRLVVNAIRKEDADKDELLRLDYGRHLWMEREIKSVANVAARDIAEFLPIAGEIPIRPEVETYRLDEANRALEELRAGSVRGAKVLAIRK